LCLDICFFACVFWQVLIWGAIYGAYSSFWHTIEVGFNSHSTVKNGSHSNIFEFKRKKFHEPCKGTNSNNYITVNDKMCLVKLSKTIKTATADKLVLRRFESCIYSCLERTGGLICLII